MPIPVSASLVYSLSLIHISDAAVDTDDAASFWPHPLKRPSAKIPPKTSAGNLFFIVLKMCIRDREQYGSNAPEHIGAYVKSMTDAMDSL